LHGESFGPVAIVLVVSFLFGIRTLSTMAWYAAGDIMRRILIVEDEPDALELLVSWIHHQRGWEVRSAQSGKTAIELSKTFKPDVVVSDYLLEDDVTGVDVIAEVQSHDAPVRCVLVTGVLRKALLDVQRISGVPILTKPLDFRRLRRLISEPAS
jgi:DNA-binding NtrC family response regulator